MMTQFSMEVFSLLRSELQLLDLEVVLSINIGIVEMDDSVVGKKSSHLWVGGCRLVRIIWTLITALPTHGHSTVCYY
jgi:hypothetical protein